jgi:hypothetical protein
MTLSLPLEPTLSDQIACVEREVRLRERAYPRWVQRRRMTQANADREIRTMRAVLETLQALSARRRPPLSPAAREGA